MKNPDPNPEDEAFEELALKQGSWQYTSGWRKKQIMETSMTQELLGRVHRELLDVLKSINQDEIHDDGHDFHKLLKDVEKALAHPEQEPVAWMWDVNNGGGYTSKGIGFMQTNIPFAKHTPLYAHPPQRTGQEPVAWEQFYTPAPQRTEQNFCSRCGKRTNDIHTCTPPQEKT